MILSSSYRKLAWVGYELMTTEFCSDALTNGTNTLTKFMSSTHTLSQLCTPAPISYFIYI